MHACAGEEKEETGKNGDRLRGNGPKRTGDSSWISGSWVIVAGMRGGGLRLALKISYRTCVLKSSGEFVRRCSRLHKSYNVWGRGLGNRKWEIDGSGGEEEKRKEER